MRINFEIIEKSFKKRKKVGFPRESRLRILPGLENEDLREFGVEVPRGTISYS
jgi:hypothetical protein